MKKLVLGAMALMFLATISCKQAADKAKDAADTAEEAIEETADKAQEAVQEVAEKVETAVDGIPSFSDPAITQYVTNYEAYIAEYTKIVESKDMAAFAGLSETGQKLAAQAQEISGKLTGDDAQKWTDYMTASAEKMQKLAQSMTQQQ